MAGKLGNMPKDEGEVVAANWAPPTTHLGAAAKLCENIHRNNFR